MELEYEKTYAFFILFSKKRYGGKMCEFNPYKFKDDNKGTANKRRDFCSFVKEIYGKILNALFNFDKTDKQEMIADAMRIAKLAIEDLLNNRVPVEKLIVSKSLNNEYKLRTKTESKDKKKERFGPNNIFIGDIIDIKYKSKEVEEKIKAKSGWKVVKKINRSKLRSKICIEKYDKKAETWSHKTIGYQQIKQRVGKMITFSKIVDQLTTKEEIEQIKQAHVRLARTMNKRDPESAPKPGDRMDMLFVKRDEKDILQYKRAEDPTYVKKHDELVPDPIYYMEKQFEKSLGQILDTVEPGISKKLFDDAKARYDMVTSGQQAMLNVMDQYESKNGKNVRKRKGIMNTSSEIVLECNRKILPKTQNKRRKKDVECKNRKSIIRKWCRSK